MFWIWYEFKKNGKSESYGVLCEKKKDTVLCWKQDFWQDGLPLGFTSPLSTTARLTCQNLRSNKKNNQNSCPSNCCLPSSNPT